MIQRVMLNNVHYVSGLGLVCFSILQVHCLKDVILCKRKPGCNALYEVEKVHTYAGKPESSDRSNKHKHDKVRRDALGAIKIPNILL